MMFVPPLSKRRRRLQSFIIHCRRQKHRLKRERAREKYKNLRCSYDDACLFCCGMHVLCVCVYIRARFVTWISRIGEEKDAFRKKKESSSLLLWKKRCKSNPTTPRKKNQPQKRNEWKAVGSMGATKKKKATPWLLWIAFLPPSVTHSFPESRTN